MVHCHPQCRNGETSADQYRLVHSADRVGSYRFRCRWRGQERMSLRVPRWHLLPVEAKEPESQTQYPYSSDDLRLGSRREGITENQRYVNDWTQIQRAVNNQCGI